MDDSRIQAMRDNRVYISGPITGIDDYMERFSNAEKELKEQGLSVVNPAKVLSAHYFNRFNEDFGFCVNSEFEKTAKKSIKRYLYQDVI